MNNDNIVQSSLGLYQDLYIQLTTIKEVSYINGFWFDDGVLNRHLANLANHPCLGKHVSLDFLDLDSMLVLLLLRVGGAEVVHRDSLAERSVDVFERFLFCLGEEEIDDRNVNSRRADEHEEELPRDVVQGNRSGDEDDNLRRELIEHAHGGTLTSDLGREDFAHVEILRGVEARAPEEDEEVDEEDGCLLAGLVRAAGIDGLQCTFAYEGDKNSAGANEHDLSATNLVDKKGREAVAGKGCSGPEGKEKKWKVA